MMTKRTRKPPVPPELRREWYRRYTEYGESYRKIAIDDLYDQRTVKSHVEKMRHETDQNQARLLFVKDNLEKHHQDLCYRVEELLSDVTGEKSIILDNPEDLYLNGLRQHLYRSALWNKLKTWNETLGNLEKQNTRFRTMIEKDVKKTPLNKIQSDPPQGVIEATVAVLVHQVQQWSRGNPGLNITGDWQVEERKEKKVVVTYGFSHFGSIKETDIRVVKSEITKLETNIRKRPQYTEFKDTVNKLMKLKQDLRLEFKGILIRRVIPGTCTYCPI